MQKATSHYTEKVVRNVCANMRAEGFHVSVATQKECYAIASGLCSADELIKAHLQKYKV